MLALAPIPFSSLHVLIPSLPIFRKPRENSSHSHGRAFEFSYVRFFSFTDFPICAPSFREYTLFTNSFTCTRVEHIRSTPLFQVHTLGFFARSGLRSLRIFRIYLVRTFHEANEATARLCVPTSHVRNAPFCVAVSARYSTRARSFFFFFCVITGEIIVARDGRFLRTRFVACHAL